jgi:putative glutamine amidotransferase
VNIRPLIASAWLKPDYRSALERAGAEIRELMPSDPVPDALANCDGLMLTGGVDVDPAVYGETDRHPTVEIDPERDEYELRLARLALDRDLPVLAICRGAQVLNVAAGGTLIQDLPSHDPNVLAHQQSEPKDHTSHEITVAEGTCLSMLLGGGRDVSGRVAVNSRHHQSVKDPAPGFVVSATAPDGVVEAIERPASRFCVGVQWHPENFWKAGTFQTLFEGLVEAARRYHADRP